MSIYTRNGDKGETGLFPSGRIAKTDARMEALGTLDELNAWLGVIRAHNTDETLDADLQRSQTNLFIISAEISCPEPANVPSIQCFAKIEAEETLFLEAEIDRLEVLLPSIHKMLYFQGPPASAFSQLARAVCRRAERRVLALTEMKPEVSSLLESARWLNRFSDFLFTLGRIFAQKSS